MRHMSFVSNKGGMELKIPDKSLSIIWGDLMNYVSCFVKSGHVCNSHQYLA
jgi:hypothetical protein